VRGVGASQSAGVMLARAMAALPSGSNARVEDVLEDEFAQRVVEHLTASHAVSGAAAIAPLPASCPRTLVHLPAYLSSPACAPVPAACAARCLSAWLEPSPLTHGVCVVVVVATGPELTNPAINRSRGMHDRAAPRPRLHAPMAGAPKPISVSASLQACGVRDHGTDHNKDRLRFPCVSTLWRSHDLPPHPCCPSSSVVPPSAEPIERVHAGVGGAGCPDRGRCVGQPSAFEEPAGAQYHLRDVSMMAPEIPGLAENYLRF
jgi:hypothetical protein